MFKMRTLVSMLCLGACSLTSGVAQSGVTTLGSNCVEQWLGVNQVGGSAAGVVYVPNGMMAAGYDDAWATVAVCPVTVDHDLGSQADFQIHVFDGKPTGNYECNAIAYDQFGNAQGASPVRTTSGYGMRTMTMSITNADPDDTWAYSIVCKIPGNPSTIVSIRSY